MILKMSHKNMDTGRNEWSIYDNIVNAITTYEPKEKCKMLVAVFKGEKKGEGLEAVWSIDPKTIDQETFDLSVKNPNKKPEERASAAECRAEIKAAYAEIGKILEVW